MNQAGMDVLIQAGLSGHSQAYGHLHNREKDCVVGVLHLTMHTTREEAYRCFLSGEILSCLLHMITHYDIPAKEYEKIIELNDLHHLDFIGIARKLEGYTKDESHNLR